MRTSYGLVGVLAVAAVGAMLARGQFERPPGQPAAGGEPAKASRTITVTGSGTVVGKPDSARVYLGVTASAKTAAEANEQVAKAVRQVQAALADLKLPTLRTRFTDSRVATRTVKDDPSRVVGYEVEQDFTVRVNEPDPVKLAAVAGQILGAGLANGANAQGGVWFFREDETALRRQAMQRAVEDALESARAYAAGAKLTVAEVVSIDATIEGADGLVSSPINPSMGPLGRAAPAVALSAGDWAVTRVVKVVCRY